MIWWSSLAELVCLIDFIYCVPVLPLFFVLFSMTFEDCNWICANSLFVQSAPSPRIVHTHLLQQLCLAWMTTELNSSHRTVFNLEYPDDIVLLGYNTQVAQQALGRLAIEVPLYGICFVPSNCRILLQD